MSFSPKKIQNKGIRFSCTLENTIRSKLLRIPSLYAASGCLIIVSWLWHIKTPSIIVVLIIVTVEHGYCSPIIYAGQQWFEAFVLCTQPYTPLSLHCPSTCGQMHNNKRPATGPRRLQCTVGGSTRESRACGHAKVSRSASFPPRWRS